MHAGLYYSWSWSCYLWYGWRWSCCPHIAVPGNCCCQLGCSSRVDSTHAFDVLSLSSLGEQAVSFLFPLLLHDTFVVSMLLSFPLPLYVDLPLRVVVPLSLRPSSPRTGEWSSNCHSAQVAVWSGPYLPLQPDSTAVVLVDDFLGGISIVAINGNIVCTLLSNSQVPTPLPPDVVQCSQTSCTTNAATRVHTMQLPFSPQ